ncbi:MAG: hypothetical protein SGI73_17525 [Chloroflexota bacterium]|nr:hypothetical protein [Chloroflexota bacterium]
MEGLSLPFVVSVIAAIVSGAFAVVVLRRWWGKRRPHLLCWGIGLALYCTGSAAQALLALVWSPVLFGVWYWSGALAVAPWLGLGTVYLLIRRGNIARNVHMALILVCVMTLPWTIFLTPFDASVWHPGADMITLYRDIMPKESRGTVRFFSPIMNGLGTIGLVGGALYSAHLFRRKRIMPNRVYGNWLIAAGGLLPALGGAFDDLGVPDFKYFGILVGAILIFAGFLLATNVPDDAPTPAPSMATRAAGD